MPARLAAKAVKKTSLKQAKPVARKPKETKAAPAKMSATTRAKVKAQEATRARVTKPGETARAKPKAPVAAKPVTVRPTLQIKPKPPVRRLTAAERAEMKRFGEVLLSERARLLVELEEIESRTARASDAERATELSSYEDHPADLASETFEREKDLAIAESVASLLNQVNTALEKVDRATYGICDACGRPIKKARLQALPFATLCLECQGRLEG